MIIIHCPCLPCVFLFGVARLHSIHTVTTKSGTNSERVARIPSQKYSAPGRAFGGPLDMARFARQAGILDTSEYSSPLVPYQQDLPSSVIKSPFRPRSVYTVKMVLQSTCECQYSCHIRTRSIARFCFVHSKSARTPQRSQLARTKMR